MVETAAPFWGQTTWNLNGWFPKRGLQSYDGWALSLKPPHRNFHGHIQNVYLVRVLCHDETFRLCQMTEVYSILPSRRKCKHRLHVNVNTIRSLYSR